MKKLLILLIVITQPSFAPLYSSQLSEQDQQLKDQLYRMIAGIDDLPISYATLESLLQQGDTAIQTTAANIDLTAQQKSQEYLDAISDFWHKPFPQSSANFAKAANFHFKALSLAIINGAKPQNPADFEQILRNMHDYFSCIFPGPTNERIENELGANYIFKCSKIVKNLLLPNWEDPTERIPIYRLPALFVLQPIRHPSKGNDK